MGGGVYSVGRWRPLVDNGKPSPLSEQPTPFGLHPGGSSGAGSGEAGEGHLAMRPAPFGLALAEQVPMLVDVAHGRARRGQGGADEADAVAALGPQLGAQDRDAGVPRHG